MKIFPYLDMRIYFLFGGARMKLGPWIICILVDGDGDDEDEDDDHDSAGKRK